MRFLLPLMPFALAALLAGPTPPATARPEFARREGRACGYCHINPRGGGARNQRGLQYARNEFRFPPRKGDLTVFRRERDRNAMIHARKMVDIDHIRVAIAELGKLAKTAKGDPGKKAARDELHELDVRGSEILGAARRLIRKDEFAEGVELLMVLVSEYKGLDVYALANEDLKELKANKQLRGLIQREEQEAKARLLYLEAARYRADDQMSKHDAAVAKLLKSYPESRAAKLARKQQPPQKKKS